MHRFHVYLIFFLAPNCLVAVVWCNLCHVLPSRPSLHITIDLGSPTRHTLQCCVSAPARPDEHKSLHPLSHRLRLSAKSQRFWAQPVSLRDLNRGGGNQSEVTKLRLQFNGACFIGCRSCHLVSLLAKRLYRHTYTFYRRPFDTQTLCFYKQNICDTFNTPLLPCSLF